MVVAQNCFVKSNIHSGVKSKYITKNYRRLIDRKLTATTPQPHPSKSLNIVIFKFVQNYGAKKRSMQANWLNSHYQLISKYLSKTTPLSNTGETGQ